MYEYIGDKHNDLPHGKGKFIFTNKNIYEGECKFGFPDGFGKYIFNNGDILTGFFSAGEINGLGTFENNMDFRLSINADSTINKAEAYEENIADHSTSNTR
jgi:hypothetical protein